MKLGISAVRRAAASLTFLLAIATLANTAAAQIRLEANTVGGEIPGRQPVCVNNNAMFTSGAGDCTDDGGEFDIQKITVGPDTQRITLDGTNGTLLVGSGTNQTTLDGASGNLSVGGDFSVQQTQNVDMGGNRVQGVADPISDTDAANKRYVDDKVEGIETTQTAHTTQITALQTENQQQQQQLDNHETRITDVETVNTQQNTRLNEIDTKNTEQDGRLTGVENKNIEQDDRMTVVEDHNAVQDMRLNGIDQSIAGINREIDDLKDRDDELAEGIAIASALENPDLYGDLNWAVAVNYGNFDGSSAIGVSAIGVIGKDFLVPGDSVAISGAVGAGFSEGRVGGRVGLQIGGR